jgi:Family of unknown function (DUF6174)
MRKSASPSPRLAACCALVIGASFLAVDARAEPSSLEAARARWRAAGIEHYRYEYRKFCMCHPEDPATTVVTVSDGKVIDVRYRYADGQPEIPITDARIDWYWTLDALLSLIESASERGLQVRASYDAELGYPATVYVDADAALEGDEIDVRVTSVVSLQP